MSPLDKKARLFQLATMILLIIAMILYFTGWKGTPASVLLWLATTIISGYWAYLEHKRRKQNHDPNEGGR